MCVHSMPARADKLKEHNQKEPPMTFKEKVNMMDEKMEQVRSGETPDFTRDDMKKLWGRLDTALGGNEKANTFYKNVQQLPNGCRKKDKRQAILWAWPGP